ncbi:MAG: CinA family protein [Hyphomicrobiales bacterium]|nr:CinA family protein [Hyphomicrobiales bacterium]
MSISTYQKAESLLTICRANGWKLATAESCTGGLVAGALTDVPGSSDVFDRGFVTYSNIAKQEMLGVPAALLEAHGAVSEEVARAMAEGALAQSEADMAVALTGIAGPDGGTEAKPVGLVFIAVAKLSGAMLCEKCIFPNDRAAVRAAAVEKALDLFILQCNN